MNKHHTKTYTTEAIATEFSVENVLSYFVDESIGEKVKSISVYSSALNKYFDVYVNSIRYLLFYKKGYTCVSCGTTATKCILSAGDNPNKAHFNFVGVNSKSEDVYFTKDHIIPFAVGGKSHIDNYQPMCNLCNNAKQAKYSQDSLVIAKEKGLVNKLPTHSFKMKSNTSKMAIDFYENWLKLHDFQFSYDHDKCEYKIFTNYRSDIKYITNSNGKLKEVINLLNGYNASKLAID